MSSHHFVKEGQEAALVILDPVHYESVAPVLEWSPLVVVFEGAVHEVFSWGIKIDVVFCSKDAQGKLDELLAAQFPVDVIVFEPSHSEIESVLNFLSKEGHHSVLFAVRNFFTVADPLTNYRKLRVSIVSNGTKWSLIPTGAFEKWMVKGEDLHVHGAAPRVEGLRQVGDYFVATDDGIVRLKSSYPFWVGEAL